MTRSFLTACLTLGLLGATPALADEIAEVENDVVEAVVEAPEEVSPFASSMAIDTKMIADLRTASEKLRILSRAILATEGTRETARARQDSSLLLAQSSTTLSARLKSLEAADRAVVAAEKRREDVLQEVRTLVSEAVERGRAGLEKVDKTGLPASSQAALSEAGAVFDSVEPLTEKIGPVKPFGVAIAFAEPLDEAWIEALETSLRDDATPLRLSIDTLALSTTDLVMTGNAPLVVDANRLKDLVEGAMTTAEEGEEPALITTFSSVLITAG